MTAFRLTSVGMAGLLAASAAFAQPPPERQAERDAWRQKMEAQMKEQDAQLDKLEQQIKSASTEQQKVDALTSAVTKLIEQRKAMHSQLQSMHERVKERLNARKPCGMTPPEPGAAQGPAGPASTP